MSAADLITKCVNRSTSKWKKQRNSEDRSSARASSRSNAFRQRDNYLTEIIPVIIEAAYMKASAGGTLPAMARQVMYAARPLVAKYTSRELRSEYFTQNLLPNYMRDHPEKTKDWDIVFDARGHLHEPHTSAIVPLGTLDVREYLRSVCQPCITPAATSSASVKTSGPPGRYSAILFIEKEGFMPLFKKVKLAERYDIAIMSTKGMSVTAARGLVDSLCHEHDIPLLILHDFDKSGFSIVGTLMRDTDRFEFENTFKAYDLGIRLADIEEWGLNYEHAPIGGYEARHKAAENMRLNFATEDDVEKLLDYRVELNEFASDKFIEWIESKLDEHGIEKVVPNKDLLIEAYRAAKVEQIVKSQSEEIIEHAKGCVAAEPIDENLTKRIHDVLDENPKMSWDEAVFSIADAAEE